MEMHKMRRVDRQLKQDEIIDIFQQNKYGVLSTIGRDGFPYGVPITYIYENEKMVKVSKLITDCSALTVLPQSCPQFGFSWGIRPTSSSLWGVS